MHDRWADHLQDNPHIDNHVAAYEEGALPVYIASVVEERQPVDPRLAPRDAEHGHKGPVEPSEAVGGLLLEQGHPQNGVCRASAARKVSVSARELEGCTGIMGLELARNGKHGLLR